MVMDLKQDSNQTDSAKSTVRRKEPPPEDSESIWTRRWIVLSFWVVIGCLGLPYWLWTTSIHRAELPLQRMHDISEGRACQLHYPLHIHLNATNQRNIQTLASKLETQLGGLPDFHLFGFRVTFSDSRNPIPPLNSALVVNLLPTDANAIPAATLRPWEPVLDIPQQTTSDEGTIIATLVREIATVFQDEQQSLSHLLGNTPFVTGKESVLQHSTREKLDARTTRAFKYAASYHLTFSLFTPSHKPSAWDIESALSQYMQPLLASLSSVSHFTVDTQVQLHAAFSPSISGPTYDNQTAQWMLQKSDLSGFINAAEWPLSPSIGTGPTINFVLYVPSSQQSPLIVAETGRTSWLIPQWGGVQILNRVDHTSDKLSDADLAMVVSQFAEQLTLLLGVPSTPSSFSLRTASLARERTTSLILSASSTLGALARLTLKLTSIAIPDSVALSVDKTILKLDQACEDIRAGRYASALESARVAEAEAESAFFEPSMVGQVYFPDEHKIAVYVPLLGPMAVPLIMAALKELRSLRNRKQKTA